MSRSAFRGVLGFILFFLPFTVIFQNCSSQFQVSPQTLDLASQNQLAAVCANGAQETGYLLGSALYPLTCGSRMTKTCVNGQWDQNVILSAACLQQCRHPDTGQALDAGSIFTSYTTNMGTTQAACDAGKITSVCNSATGEFLPAVAQNRACLVSGQVCAYPAGAGISIPTGNAVNNTVSGFQASTATFPLLCGAQVSHSCQANGQWTGNVPLYTSCTQKCIHPDNGQPVNAATSYVSYSLSTGSQAQCDAARVTSICQSNTGIFSPAPPATHFASCAVVLPVLITNFSTSTSTVPLGELATLSWNVSNATSLVLNPGNINVMGRTNLMVSPSQTTTYTLVATNSIGSVSSSLTLTVTAALMGQALYTTKCSSCHGAVDVSNLKGRNITGLTIDNAIKTKISAMKFLDGTLTSQQIDSIPPLFPATNTEPTTSSFACNSLEAEKNNSSGLIRLTGPELRNTYIATLPSAVWSALSTYYYLIPTDKFEGNISKFTPFYTADLTDQLSRFNEQVANQITANATNVAAFFGSCATLTSFTKTCFDTFLATKGPYLFRSALDPSDNNNIWTVVSQATGVINQQKTLVQLIFNDPRFSYHLELGSGAADANGIYSLTSFEIANRIAYGMTSSPPDSMLWAAATGDQLRTLANVITQVDRISGTNAYRSRATSLMKFYVGLETAGEAPTFVADFMNGVDGTNLNTAVTSEFDDYINHILFTQNGSITDLFSSTAAFPRTQALATILGTSVWAAGAAPQNAVNHPGILTRPYLQLTSEANLKLVQRGRRIRINMLCSDIPQPSATDLAGRPSLSENDLITLTRRQYIDKATLANASCVACHSKMNQLGYATENYDSIGRYSTTEKIYNSNNVRVATHPVVSSTTPTITEVDTRTFPNVTEFQLALSRSDALHQCFSRKIFHFMQRAGENLAYDSCRLNKIDNLIKSGAPLNSVLLQHFKQPSILYKRSN